MAGTSRCKCAPPAPGCAFLLEIPVPYHRRTGGSSKVAGSFRGTLRAGVRIVSTFIRVSKQTGPQKHPKQKAQGEA
jgi:hypothetical protein